MALLCAVGTGLLVAEGPEGEAPKEEPQEKTKEAVKEPAAEKTKESAAEETPKDKPAEAETKPETEADKLKKRMLAAAGQGNLTDEVIDLFKQYSLTRAKEQLAENVPQDFWTWVEGKKAIREGLCVALYPDYSTHVVKRLQELREKFAEELDSHPHLGLAFAVVFGRAGDEPPWSNHARSYLRTDRKPPTMKQSFRYYLKREKSMKFPLRNTAWPLLAYVADNETPLRERLWALKTFGRRAGRGVYYKLRYDWGKLRGDPKIGQRPRSLPNLRKYGGVCIERAYFASRVYKSLGIPGISVVGEGEQGGHAWVAWVGRKGKSYELGDVGRFDYDKYYTGYTWCPLERKRVLDREVELLAAALGRSYEEYLNSQIGCCVYETFEGDERKGKTKLLKDSVERNPFCARPWRLLADACISGVISREEGERLFDTIFKTLAPYPDLTYEVLEKVLAPRLETEAETKPDEDEIDRNLLVLKRAFQLYEKVERPDLAVKLCLLQGSYLEAAGRRKQALKLYVTASEKYAKLHYGFRDIFDRVLVMLAADRNVKRRLAFCAMMVKKVPRQRGNFDKKLKRLNPSYVYVVRAYVRALYAAGNDRAAQQWERKIQPRDD